MFKGNAITIFLNKILNTISLLVTIFLLSHYFSKTNYGIFQNYWTHLSIFSVVLGLGLNALIYIYPVNNFLSFIKKFSIKSNKLIILGLIISVLLGFGFLEFFRGYSFWVAVIFLLLYVVNIFMDNFFIISGYKKAITLINVFYNGLWVLSVWLLYQSNNVNLLIFWFLCINLFKFLCVSGYLKFFKNDKFNTELDVSDYQTMRSLWFHLYLFDILQVIFVWIDKFAVSFLFTPDISAIYFNGTIAIPFLPIIFTALSNDAQMKMASCDSNSQLIDISRYNGRNLASAAFPIFAFLLIFTKPLFDIAFTNRYSAAVSIFQVTLLTIPIRAYSFTSLLQKKGLGKVINQGAIIDLVVALIFMYPLYSLWNFQGLALAFVFSTYIQGGYYLFHLKKSLKTTYSSLLPLKNYLFKGCFSLLLMYFCSFILTGSSILSTILGGTCCVLNIFLFWYLDKNRKMKNIFD